MNLKKYSLFVVSVFVVTLYGCKSYPVRNIEHAPVPHSGQHHPTAHEVKRIILRAGSDLGWAMKPVRPGVIIGTLFVRSHMAKVRITYNRRSFSIHYMDSRNLKYDGHNIHSRYNGWVTNLERRINSMLAAL